MKCRGTSCFQLSIMSSLVWMQIKYSICYMVFSVLHGTLFPSGNSLENHLPFLWNGRERAILNVYFLNVNTINWKGIKALGKDECSWILPVKPVMRLISVDLNYQSFSCTEQVLNKISWEPKLHLITGCKW